MSKLLVDAFIDASGPGQLYRSVYKYTACGAGMGALVNGEWQYCDSLYKLGTWEEIEARGDKITALSVSSIVEGVDQCTENYEIEILEGEPADQFNKRFYAALDEVEKEADQIWQDTHGCETCAKHWGVDFDEEVGQIPVWTECPDCEGTGTII